MALFSFLIVGLLAGLLARAVLPGNQSMGWVGTMLLGLVGSFVGGAISTLLRGDNQWTLFTTSSLIWSTVGALLVLGVTSMAARRRL